MEPRFRPAESADADLIVAFMRELYAEGGGDSHFDERAGRAALERLVADRSLGRVWVIEAGDEAIGYLAVTPGYSLEYHGRDAFVDELYVAAGHRRRGVGTRALEFAAERCRELGVRALHLEVERGNAAAQALYRKAGFVDHDHYLMTRRLRG